MLNYRVSIAGLSELDGFTTQRVSHVISLLDPDWPVPEALAAFPPHEWHEFRLHDVIEDSQDQRSPETEDIERLLEIGAALADADVDHLLVHCHMGMSRSTAAVLILKAQFHPGQEAAAVEALLSIRQPAWPNSRMLALADRLLGRGGALVDAAQKIYFQTAREYPHFVDAIRDTARRSEIPAGY